MANLSDTVSALGEFGLIERIRKTFPRIDLTDDCAWLPCPHEGDLLLTTDAGIRGTHFPEGSEFMRDAGWRTMAGAVSDINASGGNATGILLALQIPPLTFISEFDDFMEGVREFTEWSDIPLIGGNITTGDKFAATVSVIGVAKKHIGRNGAKIDDIVVLTGPIGGSEVGRILLMNEIDPEKVDPDVYQKLTERFMRPTPPLGIGEKLGSLGASSIIDISDGLLAEIHHIANTSGVEIIVDIDKIPLYPGVKQVATFSGIIPQKLASVSGEEFELVATISLENMKETIKVLPELTVIGHVESGKGVSVILEGKKVFLDYLGWRHF